MRRWLAILVAALASESSTGLRAGEVGLISINGAIGPATATYISRAIEVAQARSNACLIIELDTPGGLLDSTKAIVQSLYESKVPTVVYVTPSGGGATSAGCFITLAADIAAMAPNTTIGAAHPVGLGLGSSDSSTNDVMSKKVENYAVSTIEAIAEKRGRNIEWAKSAVRESASITAEKALELNVVDLIAKDVPDLLEQIDGREVNGKSLKTAGATARAIPMVAREKLFQLLWRPEVMMVLMLIVIYGIIGELSSPGAILPGVVGGIALILALYMAAILPINTAGLALIGLSLALFVIDIFAPTHGVLTFGGIVSFFLGCLMLFNRSDPAFHLSLAYIIPATLLTAAFFVFVVGSGLRAQFLPVRTGKETMVGKTVSALEAVTGSQGRVFIDGEYWNAVSDVPIGPGQPAEIVAVEGLTLKLKPKH
jgi:membrane-bound serine protease (ClpP class)